jgi:hypothetical protein
MGKKILTPDGTPMDYKVAPLKKKTVKDKVAEELAKKAAKPTAPKKPAKKVKK